jgi:hypothetical protein
MSMTQKEVAYKEYVQSYCGPMPPSSFEDFDLLTWLHRNDPPKAGSIHFVKNINSGGGGGMSGSNFIDGPQMTATEVLARRSEITVLKTLDTMNDAERKGVPLLTGVIDYFLPALIEVAKVSKAGNDQHNPGEQLHWTKGKSTDHGNTALRHLAQHGTIDTDGRRHTAKAAWRILAMLTIEIEAEQAGMSYAEYTKQLEEREKK